MLMWILSAIFVILTLFYVIINWNYNYWRKRNVPGPEPKFLLGNLPCLITQKTALSYEIDDIYQEYKSKYNFIGIFQIRTPTLLLISPDLIKDVEIKHFKSFYDTKFVDMVDKKADPILSKNVFFMPGVEWKDKRAEITATYSPSKIKGMYPYMEEVSKRMTNYIIEKGDKTIEIQDLTSRFTADVVLSCIFAIDAHSFSKDESKSVPFKMGIAFITPPPNLKIYSFITSIFPFINKFYRMSLVPPHVDGFFINLMREAIKIREEIGEYRGDFLDHLINLKMTKGLTDVELTGHGMQFFLDGFETVGVLITFALYEIAKNKIIQEKLRAEIEGSVDANGNILYENLMELPYLDQVMNETLRLWPPLGYNARKCTAPIELDVNASQKAMIKKGTYALIPIWSILHDPDHYENPYSFNPDRFSSENGGEQKYKDLGVFFPFGDGPRKCLGMRYAIPKTKRAIFEIIHNFEITVNKKTVEPVTLDPKVFVVLIKPENDIYLDFKRILK